MLPLSMHSYVGTLAPHMKPIIAVLIPCHNEEAAIGKVVRDFREALPEAYIFVYDNNSTDRTCEMASSCGRHRCVRSPCRARAMWCVACSPTSRPTCSFWLTGTTPTTLRVRRGWSTATHYSGIGYGEWSTDRFIRRGPIVRDTNWETFCSQVWLPTSSAIASPTCCPATGFSAVAL